MSVTVILISFGNLTVGREFSADGSVSRLALGNQQICDFVISRIRELVHQQGGFSRNYLVA
jgi:hypothetical protein